MTPQDGMPPDALRELVREVLRDVLPSLANGAVPPPGVAPAPPAGLPAGFATAPAAPPTGIPPAVPPPAYPAPATESGGPGGAASRDGAVLQPVRLATDEDLHAFVLRVVALADNPKRRRDLLAGRLRFTLAPAGPAARPATATRAGHRPATATAAGHRLATATPAGHRPAIPNPGGHAPATPSAADHRIEKGAVTERAVQAAASAGARLVLGPRAVMTPLARDRARALGVPIEKER